MATTAPLDLTLFRTLAGQVNTLEEAIRTRVSQGDDPSTVDIDESQLTNEELLLLQADITAWSVFIQQTSNTLSQFKTSLSNVVGNIR